MKREASPLFWVAIPCGNHTSCSSVGHPFPRGCSVAFTPAPAASNGSCGEYVCPTGQVPDMGIEDSTTGKVRWDSTLGGAG